jgi:DNA mismatch repair ATPase MutS
MEIKAILQKPYTDEERENFIVEYNHNQGYVIEETETELQALGYTEEEIALQEKERISKLTCTKRVFALMLQELGITYTMLKELIATNEQAQLEWDLCVSLERQNPLLDVMALQLGITSEQLDGLFMYANGELTIDEFRSLYVKEVEDENTGDTID